MDGKNTMQDRERALAAAESFVGSESIGVSSDGESVDRLLSPHAYTHLNAMLGDLPGSYDLRIVLVRRRIGLPGAVDRVARFGAYLRELGSFIEQAAQEVVDAGTV